MSDAFRVSVRADGESRTMLLAELLAENEGAPAFCERVRKLEPGEVFTFGPDITVRRFSEGERRRTRHKVLINFHGKPTWATVTIDKVSGLVAVRPRRRRKEYVLRLSDVAELVIDRVARADAGVGKLNGRRRRVH